MLQQAVLLIGPTGAGKSPLGDWLQTNGLWGRVCHHFDFGTCLRQIVSGPSPGFSADEIRYLRDVVASGALLENTTFHLAVRILTEYRHRRGVQPHDLLVMNGLPRHLGQAADLSAYVDFLAVFYLQCDAGTVLDRLRLNTGGDRVLRTDDTPELVANKLEIFTRRTAPLLSYYRQRGVPVLRVPVFADSRPQDLISFFSSVRQV